MTDDRRYQDHEVRRIVDLALRQDEADIETFALPDSDGLTVSELEQVGKDIGLSPARIARAIVQFEGRGLALPSGTTLGLPTSVGQVTSLRRAPTDQEWGIIVTDLRSTFGTKGVLAGQGETREWSAGDLHAFVEPVAGGYRLRLSESVKGPVVASWVFGGFFIGFALMILVILLGKDDPGFRYVVPAFAAMLGSALIGVTASVLPGWARRRQLQMEELASRVTALIQNNAGNGL